jgi:hypothetical protein
VRASIRHGAKIPDGIGELAREAADELNAVATELQGLIKQMQAVLRK